MNEHRPHPAVAMGRQRALVWEKTATDEDFFEYLKVLRDVYAKRKYTGNGKINTKALFDDFEQWLIDERKKQTEELRKEISGGPSIDSKPKAGTNHSNSPL